MPDAAEPSGWDGSSGWDGTVSETVAYLTRAHRLLEHMERTNPSPLDRLTFFELDDVIRCVSRALLSLGTGLARPNPVAPSRLEWIDGTASTGNARRAQEDDW